MNNNLYIIIPYFNYFNNFFRALNLIAFLKSCIKYSNNFLKCKIIIAEGFTSENSCHTLDSKDSSINSIFQKVVENENIIYVKYPIPQKIWVKENLINLVVKNHLPKDWKYFCWLDGDIIFEDEDWIQNSIDLLNQFDIIQMFSVSFNQSRYGIKDFIGAYGHIYNSMKNNNNKIISILFPTHTGYAWGITRNFYEKIGGLWDCNIIGSADSIIARCTTQILEEQELLKISALNIIYSENYSKQLLEYYLKFKNCKYSYLNCHVFHLYHGDLLKRKYVERHQILRKYNYDKTFLKYNDDGIVYLENLDLQKEIEDYLTIKEN